MVSLHQPRLVEAARTCNGGQRTIPFAAAVGRKHFYVQVPQLLKPRRGGKILAPHDRIDRLRLGLPLHRDEVELDDRKMILRGERRLRSGNDRNSVHLRLPLQTGGDIRAVAQHGVVEVKV